MWQCGRLTYHYTACANYTSSLSHNNGSIMMWWESRHVMSVTASPTARSMNPHHHSGAFLRWSNLRIDHVRYYTTILLQNLRNKISHTVP